MNQLIKFWKQIFPPNDWVVVWSDSAYINWTDINEKNHFFYTIEFSKYRDKFRLICKGKTELKWKNCYTHQFYNVALSKLAEYNNNLLQIQFNSKNKIK